MALKPVFDNSEIKPQRSEAMKLAVTKIKELVSQASDLVCARCYREMAIELAPNHPEWSATLSAIESLPPETVAPIFRKYVDTITENLEGKELRTAILGLSAQLIDIAKEIS